MAGKPPNKNRKPPAQEWGEHASWPQPEDMRQWLQEETQRVMKEAELRITDAAAFVTDYLTGEIGKKQVGERLREYHKRWGDEALRDVPDLRDGMTAEEIYKAQQQERERKADPNWVEKARLKAKGERLR